MLLIDVFTDVVIICVFYYILCKLLRSFSLAKTEIVCDVFENWYMNTYTPF